MISDLEPFFLGVYSFESVRFALCDNTDVGFSKLGASRALSSALSTRTAEKTIHNPTSSHPNRPLIAEVHR